MIKQILNSHEGFAFYCFISVLHHACSILTQYIILLTIIVILELAAGISGLVFKDKVYSTSESEYTKGWQKAMGEYGDNNDATKTVDTLQSNVSKGIS